MMKNTALIAYRIRYNYCTMFSHAVQDALLFYFYLLLCFYLFCLRAAG